MSSMNDGLIIIFDGSIIRVEGPNFSTESKGSFRFGSRVHKHHSLSQFSPTIF
jgi:hypothetical protein